LENELQAERERTKEVERKAVQALVKEALAGYHVQAVLGSAFVLEKARGDALELKLQSIENMILGSKTGIETKPREIENKEASNQVVLADQTTIDSEREISNRYTVQPGDTLSNISQRYYGTTKRWDAIYEANKEIIPNKNYIRPGIVLVIP
jgi:nucleoid-associated protein YgaU